MVQFIREVSSAGMQSAANFRSGDLGAKLTRRNAIWADHIGPSGPGISRMAVPPQCHQGSIQGASIANAALDENCVARMPTEIVPRFAPGCVAGPELSGLWVQKLPPTGLNLGRTARLMDINKRLQAISQGQAARGHTLRFQLRLGQE
jgi:hypothetical protein